ncbi:MAG: ELM1/GtrOC1 family putative glycosyltransferase [Pseudomonadota bacterium]
MLSIWRFTDGKRGHDNQSLGLVEALCRLAPCRVQTFTVKRGWPQAFAWLLGRFSAGRNLQKPDLILGAGHATHWPMLAARRAHGGKIAVLMKPSLPLSWFDRVIAPAHDFPNHPHPNPPPPRGREEIILTEGPLNRILPSAAKDEGRGLMLIGGPSSEYGWSETALLKQIHLVALHRPETDWLLTTSRRTPRGFLANLGKLGLANVQAFAHDEVAGDWLPHQLARAKQVWVTPDSASMVYEALTSGAAVGCFELPYARPGRVARGLEKLAREGRLTMFADWERRGRLEPGSQPLNEAERCARLLLQCLNRAN